MHSYRPGYNGVRSDTRRALVPDLPVDKLALVGPGRRDIGALRRAKLAMITYFGLVLLVGLAVVYEFSPATTTFAPHDSDTDSSPSAVLR